MTTYSKSRTAEEIKELKRHKQIEYRSRPEVQERQRKYLEENRNAKRLYDKERQSRSEIRERRLSLQKKNMYGITGEEYQAKLDSQNGRCGACDKSESRIDYRTGRPFNLAVDHNHTTGKIRGLLCTKCNLALGLVNEQPELLVNYMRRFL